MPDTLYNKQHFKQRLQTERDSEPDWQLSYSPKITANDQIQFKYNAEIQHLRALAGKATRNELAD